MQKRNRTIFREMKLANDCAKCFVRAKNVAHLNKKFSLSFAKNFLNVLFYFSYMFFHQLFKGFSNKKPLDSYLK